MRRVLRREGFVPMPKRGKGDHEVWKHPDGRLVVLDPGKDPPPLGTFKRILQMAGLSEDLFRKGGGQRGKG
ncbi:type II toxin-antitoxin system HicA family toxin [Thermus hydrothermalis]